MNTKLIMFTHRLPQALCCLQHGELQTELRQHVSHVLHSDQAISATDLNSDLSIASMYINQSYLHPNQAIAVVVEPAVHPKEVPRLQPFVSCQHKIHHVLMHNSPFSMQNSTYLLQTCHHFKHKVPCKRTHQAHTSVAILL